MTECQMGILGQGFERTTHHMSWDVVKVSLTGRLGGDPTLTHGSSENGTRANFRMAATSGSDKDNNKETAWYNCTLFGKRAETFVGLAKKGARILVFGRQKVRVWTGQDGQEKTSIDITVDDYMLLGDTPNGNGNSDDGATTTTRSAPAAAPAPALSGLPF
jgi:single-strand DNA-binding protein